MSIRYRLNWTDKLALSIALIIAGSALFVWMLGLIGLWGNSQFRFGYAMADWTMQVELGIVPLTWFALRGIDMAARAVVRARYSRLPAQSAASGPAFAAPSARSTV
jgi:hypothetical protein